MIGIIKRPNINIKLPPNPDDYFDPVTHIATEANFIAFLEAGGKYDDTSLIGYKVTLSNSAAYNGGTYVIADVNHDSTNTGQTNCYDLISQDCFNNQKFSIYENPYWRDSTIRTWLNNTFYNGFSSDILSHIMNIKYKSEDSWYNDDKIILPSYIEVGFTTLTSAGFKYEGSRYPIFTDYNSRVKKFNGSAYSWWTRSRYFDTSGGYNIHVWKVDYDGWSGYTYSNGSSCTVPILRVS